MKTNTKLNRNYGYDILINTFEPFLRRYLINEVFLVNYGKIDWKKHIPEGVINEVSQTKEEIVFENCSIDEFFDELTFLNLKDIIIFSNNFNLTKSFFGDISKEKFIEIMDELNIYRRKIAHAKSTFSDIDLEKVIEYVNLLSQGDSAKEIRVYLQNEHYKRARDFSPDFFEEYECPNNLPPESYDLDGGFVGREKEIRALRKLIRSDQDRIITITGAGGVGKTAIALKLAYSFLLDPQNPFDAIMWFSAKTSKLTEDGIIPMESGIRSDEQLIKDILTIVDPSTLQCFMEAKFSLDVYKDHLYKILSSQKCLVIIDNIETILKDDALITFIKDIPRPSQVLITSRIGLGEIERRYPVGDMPEKDAIQLFRIVAKERNRLDLLGLKKEMISKLVKQVRCYPLLIKWSIGQVCLGKDIEEAFSQIFVGESEIAKFSFNDVFSLFSENAKLILFSMIVYGDKPISRYLLMHLANLTDEQFEDAIRELIVTSFVVPESREKEGGIVTEFSMLTLTRGFIEHELDDKETVKEMLLTRYHHLSEEIQEFEKSKSSYYQSLVSLGIKSPEEQVAFTYVKSAKNYQYNNDLENAEKNYKQALKIAPNFSYVLTEYSKFEFKRKHLHKALELAKKAVEIKPESYHAWFNYGISLRKAQMYNESIKCLQKAKDLNPQHLPIFNELGRVYTIIGDYEKAESEFQRALKEEKYPNYRHKVMTLQFLADNYKRWAEEFASRRDFDGQIKLLEKGFELICEALKIAPWDRKLWSVYWNICKEFGIALSKKVGFDKGKPYLEKCLQTMKIGRIVIIPDKEIVAEVCFYLAALRMDIGDKNVTEIEKYINNGLANCISGSKWFNKINQLKIELEGQGTSITKIERKYGRIKYYNVSRKFGVIEVADNTYLFFLSGFRQRIPQEALHNLEGKTVSCILKKNPKKDDSMIADDISFEEA